MGSFYSNVTVRDRSQQQVLAALNANGVAALVSPAIDGVTVIYPSFEDEPGWQEPAAAAAMVSQWLGAPALAAMVHHSDVLILALAEGGDTIETYNSCPSYFGSGEIEPPTGMDAAALVRLMGPGADAAAVEAILRKGTPAMSMAEDGHGEAKDGRVDVYAWEDQRHADLVTALGHPPLAPCLGADYILDGDLPDEFDRESFAPTDAMRPTAAAFNRESSLVLRIPYESRPASDDEVARCMTLATTIGREIMKRVQPGSLGLDENGAAFVATFSGPGAEALREAALPVLRRETWPAGTTVTLTDASSGATERLEAPFA